MVKVGIVGCGTITMVRHAPEYYNNPDAEIAGFYDIVPERAAELAGKFGGKVYETCDELLADTTIDAVSICTANDTHAEYTVKALAAGKNVLCEKPMATSLEECKRVIEAERRSGKQLMLAHNQRFFPAHKRAKHILQSGELGKPISFSSVFEHAGPETWMHDTSRGIWYFQAEKSLSGSLVDLGVHKIDLIQWLLDDNFVEATAVKCTLDKKAVDGTPISADDNAYCILKTSTGIIGTIKSSWTNYGLESNQTIIYCTDGVMIIGGESTNRIELQKRDGTQVKYTFPDASTNQKQVPSGVIDSFVSSIKNNRTVEVSSFEGYSTIATVLACYESSNCSRGIPISQYDNR